MLINMPRVLASAPVPREQSLKIPIQVAILYLAHHVESTGKPAESPGKVAEAEYCQNGLAKSLLEAFLYGCDVCI